MHELFRTLGQQKGMQQVRVILPEEIDAYINDAIAEKTLTEIQKGVTYSVQVNAKTLSNAIGNINLFKSLYRNARFSIDVDKSDGLVKYHNSDIGYYEITLPTDISLSKSNNVLTDDEYYISPMLYLGFSVEYDDKSRGNAKSCRLIGSEDLQNTLNDYCNAADKDYPIATLSGQPVINDLTETTSNTYDNFVMINTGKTKSVVKYLNVIYLKKPNVVDYKNGVDCDLSDYSHYEIVEIAVQKFIRSIGVKQS